MMRLVNALAKKFIATLACLWTVVSVAGVTVTPSFNPTSGNQYSNYDLTVSILNSSANTLTDASLNIALSAGLTIASTSLGINTCGFTANPTLGGTSLSLTAGSVPGAGGTNGNCVVTFSVTPSTSGNLQQKIFTNDFSATDGALGTVKNTSDTSATVSASLVTLTNLNTGISLASTSGGNMYIGDTGTLTYTITNTNSITVGFSTFNLTMPTGLSLVTSGAGSMTCSGANSSNGTVSLNSSTSFSVTGGVVGASPNTCVIRVPVITSAAVTAQTTIPVVIGSNSLSNNRNVGNAVNTTNTIVYNPLTISTHGFSSGLSSTSPFPVGVNNTLTITVTNASLQNAMSISTLTDTLGSALTGSILVNPTCTGGSAGTAAITGQVVTWTGISINANKSCTLQVRALSNNLGSGSGASNSNNTALISNSTTATVASINGNGPLAVTSSNPAFYSFGGVTVTKTASDAIVYPGQSVNYTITVYNWNSQPATVNLADALPSDGSGNQIKLTGPVSLGGGCSGASPAGANLDPSFSMSGLVVAGASGSTPGSCVVTVPVSVPELAVSGTQFTNSIPSGGSGLSGAVVGTTAIPHATSGISGYISPSVTITVTAVKITPTFSANIYPGQTNTLRLTVTNPVTNALSNFATTSAIALPSGMVVALAPTASTTCGGTFAPVAGNGSLSFSGATIPAATNGGATDGSCYFLVNVTYTPPTSTLGVVTLTVPADKVSNSESMKNSAVSGSFTVLQPLYVSLLAATPNYFGVGETATISFTIGNYGATTLSGVSIGTGTFVNYALAANPAVNTTCTAVTPDFSTALSGANNFLISGIQLAGNTTCTVSFQIQATAGASWTLGILQNKVLSATYGQYSTSSSNYAVINLYMGITASGAFSPINNSVYPYVVSGGVTNYTLTLNNNTGLSLSNVSAQVPLTTLTAGLTVAAAPNARTSCAGSPVITATPGAITASLTGVSLPKGGSCTFTFAVKAVTNSSSIGLRIPVGYITSAEGASNSGNVDAVIYITTSNLVVNNSFSPASLTYAGQTVDYKISFIYTQSPTLNLSNITLTDVLPSGIQVATNPNLRNTCANATVIAPPGGTSIAISGGSLAMNGTCDVILSVTTSRAQSLIDTILAGAVTTNEGVTNSQATSATLSNVQGIGVALGFSPATIAPGATSVLTYTITNTWATANASNVGYANTLPTGLTFAALPGVSTTCTGGTASVSGGTLTLSGASINAQSSCTVSVNVTSNAVNAYVATIGAGAITSAEGFANGVNVSATLNVNQLPTLTLDWGTTASIYGTSPPNSSGSVYINSTGAVNKTLNIRISNPVGGAALTGVSISPSLPNGIYLSSASIVTSGCGSPTAIASIASTTFIVNGASIGANTTCVISATVSSVTPGAYAVSLPVGALTTTQGLTNSGVATLTGSPGTTSISLTALNFPTVSSSFNPTSVLTNGTSTYTITLSNSNALALAGAALSFNLPYNLIVASVPGNSNTCSGTFAPVAGATSLSMTSGTIPGATGVTPGTCTVTVNLTSAYTGTYTTTIPVGALATTYASVNQSASTAYLLVGSSTPPQANDFSQTFTVNTTSVVTTLSGTPSSGASISSYQIATLPNTTVGDLYCSSLLITLSQLPKTCANNALTFTAKSVGAATWTYTVTDSVPSNSLPATVSVSVVSPANLTIFETATSPVLASGTITYTVTIGNSGTSTFAGVATVKNQLPAGVIATAATPGSGVQSVSCVDASSHTLPTSSTAGALLTCTVTPSTGILYGGNASFSLTTTAPSTSGNLVDYVSIDSSGGTSPPTPNSGACTASNCSSASTLVVTPAAYALSKSAPATVLVNGNLVYTFTLSNTGTQTPNSLVATIKEKLPAGVSFVSTTGVTNVAGVDCGANPSNLPGATLICTVNLNAALTAGGNTATFTITGRAPSSATTLTANYASVDATPGGTSPPEPGVGCVTANCAASGTTVVNTAAAFRISKSVDTPNALGGSDTYQQIYTLTITNAGTSSSGTVANLKEAMPVGSVITAITKGSNVSSGTCTDGTKTLTFNAATNLPYTSTSTELSCTANITALTLNQQAVFTITAKAPASAGNYVNYATVDPAGGSSPATASGCSLSSTCASVAIQSDPSSVTVSKALSTVNAAAPGANVKAGDVLKYAISISGGTYGGTTILTETVPTGTTYTSVAGDGWTLSGGNYTQSVTVAANASVTKYFTVTLGANLADGLVAISNSVSSSVGACSSCQVSIATVPKLSVSKSVPTSLPLGGTATYTVTVANQGGTSTSGTLTFTDTLPTGLSFGAQTAGSPAITCTASGQTLTCTGSPTIAAYSGGSPGSASIGYSVNVASNASGLKTNEVMMSVLGGDPRTPGAAPSAPASGSSAQSGDKLSAKSSQTVSASAGVISGFVRKKAGANFINIPGVTVSLFNQSGQLLAQTTSAADGSYSFPALAPGVVYSVSFSGNNIKAVDQNNARPTQSSIPVASNTEITSIPVVGGANYTDQNAVIVDPSGVVYDSVTRNVIAGAKVYIGTISGSTFTALTDGQLDATYGTTNGAATGADGGYKLFPINPAAIYYLAVVPPLCSLSASTPYVTCPVGNDYVAPNALGNSTLIPSQAGVYTPLQTSSMDYIQAQAGAPTGGSPTTYYTAFNLTTASNGVGNNQIPIDSKSNLTLSKTVNTASVLVGAEQIYTLTLSNSGATKSGAAAVIRDVLPAGAVLTAVNRGAGVDAVTCSTTVGGSSVLATSSYTVPANTSLYCSIALSNGGVVNAGTAAISMTVNAPTQTGTYTNYASVDASGGNAPPNPVSGCNTTSCANVVTTVTALPMNLTLAKTQTSAATVTAGSTITYQLSLGNSGGTISGANFTVKDQLPAGVVATAVTPITNIASISCSDTSSHTLPTASSAGALLTCSGTFTSAIAPGIANGGAVFNITATAPSSAGTITNFAKVGATGGTPSDPPTSGTCPDTSCGNVTTTILAPVAPDAPAYFALSKTVNADKVLAGSSQVFTLTITNRGDSYSGLTATVAELMPVGSVITSITGLSGISTSGVVCKFNNIAISLPFTVTGSAIPLICTATLTSPLAPNAKATFSMTNNAPLVAGQLVNYASVDGNGNSNPPTPGAACLGPNCANVPFTVITPATLTLSKSVNVSSVVAGASHVYTLTVTNIGQIALTSSVTFAEMMPLGSVVTSVAGVNGIAPNGVLCKFNNLPVNLPYTVNSNAVPLVCSAVLTTGLNPNASASINITANAPSGSGMVINYASVDPTGNGNPLLPGSSCVSAACAKAQLTVLAPASFSLRKSQTTADTVVTGSAMTYKFTVGNSGGVSSGNVFTLRDKLPQGVVATIAEIDSASLSSINCRDEGTGVPISANAPSSAGATILCNAVLSKAGIPANTLLTTPEAASFTLKAIAPALPGVITNYASIDSAGGTSPIDPGQCSIVGVNLASCGAVSTTIKTKPNFAMSKAVDSASVIVGGKQVYTLNISNQGQTISGTSFTFNEHMPVGTVINDMVGLKNLASEPLACQLSDGSLLTLPHTVTAKSNPIRCIAKMTQGLAFNEQASLAISTYAPLTAGDFTNYATVDATGGSNPPTALGCVPGGACGVASGAVKADVSMLTVQKFGSATTVELGDSLMYTVIVRLESGRPQYRVTLTDRLPRGFKYIANSAKITMAGSSNAVIQGDQVLGISGLGPVLTAQIGQLSIKDMATLTYRVRLETGAQAGDGINRVSATSASGVVSNEASFKVTVGGGVFSTDACIVGKVFVDCNGNAIQDNDPQEMGIPSVRIYMENGTYFITDRVGSYSMCGLQPTTHVLKLDTLTLPKGSELAPSSNRNAGDPGSLFSDLKYGELQKADFIVGSCTPEVLTQVQIRREALSKSSEVTAVPALSMQTSGTSALPAKAPMVMPGQAAVDPLVKGDRVPMTLRFDSDPPPEPGCKLSELKETSRGQSVCAPSKAAPAWGAVR